MGAVGANVSPHADDGSANGVEPQFEDAPDRATLIPGTSKGPGFSLSWDDTSDDATSVPGSFDIVDVGTEAAKIPSSSTFARQLGASGGGRGVDMFTGVVVYD
jgi:hypothetical protein